MRQRTPFQRIDVQRAEALLSRGDPLVLDARDAGSFAASRIEARSRFHRPASAPSSAPPPKPGRS